MSSGLDGTSHEALHFTRNNWRGFLRVSLIPVVVFVVFGIIYFIPFKSIVTAMFEAASRGENIEQGFVFRIVKIQLIAMLGSLVSLAAYNWWSVRLVRFVLERDDRLFALDGKMAMSVLMWLVYTLGIGAVTVLGSFVVFLPVMALTGALAAFGMPDDPGPAMAIAAGTIGMLVLTFWITLVTYVWLRLSSGLPPVAMGHTPDFYRDLWQRSRGYGWAMVWRISVLATVYALFAVIVMTAITIGPVMDIFQAAGSVSPNGSLDVKLIGALINRIIAAEVVIGLTSVPVLWWVFAWLCIVYERIGTQTGRPNLLEPAV